MTESIQHTSESGNAKASDAQNRQITINNNMTLLQEVRKTTLKKGCNIIQAEGVPNNVEISSIMIGISSEKPCRVVSKSFRAAETMNRQRAVSELKGAEVLLQYTTPFKLQTYNGKLLFVDGDNIGIERPNGVTMIAKCPEAISVTKKLNDLREMPALEFEIESPEDQEAEFALLYRSNNPMSCPMSHNLVFDEKNSVIKSFESSALLSNRSGCDWSDVTIKIMTGGQDQPRRGNAKAMRSASPYAASLALESADFASASAESVGERKLFELPAGISVKNGDTKLIQLIAAGDIPVTKEYYLFEDTYENQPAQLKLTFKNLACEKSVGLGKPIPAGTVSVYQPDSSGSLQLTNQVEIPDASIGDSVILELGGTSDIKATRSLVDTKETAIEKAKRRLTKKEKSALEQTPTQPGPQWIKQLTLRRQSFEVSIKNFKDQEVAVVVPQTLSDNQKIVESSIKPVVGARKLVQTTVIVPARTDKGAGEQKLTYIVETLYEKQVQVGQ